MNTDKHFVLSVFICGQLTFSAACQVTVPLNVCLFGISGSVGHGESILSEDGQDETSLAFQVTIYVMSKIVPRVASSSWHRPQHLTDECEDDHGVRCGCEAQRYPAGKRRGCEPADSVASKRLHGLRFPDCRDVCSPASPIVSPLKAVLRRDGITMSTSMTGLAAKPGTAVLPTCSMAVARSRTAGQILSRSRLNRSGHSGLWATTRTMPGTSLGTSELEVEVVTYISAVDRAEKIRHRLQVLLPQ